MLRESTATSIGRSSSRLRVSNSTPTIGAPSMSGCAPRVISRVIGSSARVPSRVMVSPMAWLRMMSPACSARVTGSPAMVWKVSPTSMTPKAGEPSTTSSTSTPSPTKLTS